ncbi:colanic acid biosynthesis acetyltransferase WcaF [Phenylobacterium sp. J367]|uniref:colanic acid biosynthesis acetyltransferase WcaF n=1 Tax=Phenylobacterium sp. J367 TaxID=2898435 RepID=UPI0035B4F082
MSHPLSAASSRPLAGGPSFSFRNRITRLSWGVTWALFARWTPNSFNIWRLFLLHLYGAKVRRTSAISPSAKIWFPPNLVLGDRCALGRRVNCYNMAPVTIGDHAIVSEGAFLCAGSHDVDDPNFQLVVAPVVIGPSAWLAADAMVGPGVIVGEGAVLGARSVAFRDLQPWTIYVGNPASAVRARANPRKEPPRF